MRDKTLVAVLMLVLGFYVVVVIGKAFDLFQTGGVVAVLFGIALIISAALAAGLCWREVRFGQRTAQLGDVLAGEGGIPNDDLPRRPSGRVDREAAEAVFAERRTETEADPTSWRAWYRLALAYDLAGDRTRGRAAARHAIELFDHASRN